MPERRHILGVETWNGGSHAAVRRSIDRHSRHVWTWVTLPARGWRWRMRTGAWRLAEMLAAGEVKSGEASGPAAPADDPGHAAAANDIRRGACEVVFATSLLSIPDLHAAVHRHGLTSSPDRLGLTVDAPAGRPRTLLYMHENQAAYPAGPSGGDDRDAHLALTNLGSILAADRVLWNSDWNRRSFAAELSRTMKHDPDPPAAAAREALERTGHIAWPPVEDPVMDGASTDGSDGRTSGPDANSPAARSRAERRAAGDDGAIRVVWPHRWEHDKGPDELLTVAERWTESLNLRWILLGQRFGDVPPELATFRERFGRAIEHDGWMADADAYRRRLGSADWVLSTARHEFFGIAVTEALLAGCLPWLPDRLSYPELLPAEARGLHPAKPPADATAIRAAIRVHLEPAIAPHAVATIDDHIDAVAEMR